jgi:predicted hydrocarbon binding protein
MNKKEFEKAIDFYRSLAKKEMENEKIVNGTFIGPRSEVKTDKSNIGDIINPSRPFLSKDVGEKLDSAYASTFRIGHFNMPEQLASTGQGTTFVGGMEFGANLVKQGIINSLDELVPFLADYKIGIVDIFGEKEEKSEKTMDIRVYECIECADLPNVGKPICFFEAGVITGIFRELTKKDVTAEEIRCWTSGYSFCQFDVKIKNQKK